MNPALDIKWFLQLNGTVKGPFTQDALQSTLQTFDDSTTAQALIWKRGLPEWVRASKFQTAKLQALETSGASDHETKTEMAPANDDLFEKTFTQTFTQGAFYRAQVNFVDQPLMTKNELLSLIAKQQDVSKVSIQDPKTKEWKEVYAFPDIVERLGLSRRKQPRVPILAQFTGKSNNNQEVSYRVITISQGGMGFTENHELKIGDEVEGQISSPHFFQSINVKAEVIYAGQDGYIGLKFTQIPDEARSAIIDYIKKFGKNAADPQ